MISARIFVFATLVSLCLAQGDWCSRANTCSECVTRATIDSSNGRSARCQWCLDYRLGTSYGCFSSADGCPQPTTNNYVRAETVCTNFHALPAVTVTFLVFSIVGLILGAILLLVASRLKDDEDIWKYLIGSYILGTLFWGALPFSVCISWLAARRKAGKGGWSTCSGIVHTVFGLIEIAFYVGGTLAAFIIDGTEASAPWGSYGLFTLVVAMPCVWSAQGVLGLPRVIWTTYEIKRGNWSRRTGPPSRLISQEDQ